MAKLPLSTPLLNMVIAVLLTSYMFYGFVSLPTDLDQTDVLFWTYAKGKLASGLSSLGGYTGVGHPAVLYRKLKSFMDDPVGTNYTKHLGINVTDTVFNGVEVRLYEPHNKVRNAPAIVFFHSGLWIVGSMDNHDHIASHLSKALGVLVVSVGYRLAPEHPYPEPLQDCYEATKYLLEYSKEFNIRGSGVALLGIGAGGNLAAAVALKLRDRAPGLPYPGLQVLINPILQPLDCNTPSYYQNQNDASFSKSLVVQSWLWYGLGSDGHQYSKYLMDNSHTSALAKQSKISSYVSHNLLHKKYLHESYRPNKVDYGDDQTWDKLKHVFLDPYFAPLLADDLSGLPRTYIVAAQHDVVRDDGVMYARRLEKAGVPVTLDYQEKAIHAMLVMKDTVLGDKLLKDLTDNLIKKL